MGKVSAGKARLAVISGASAGVGKNTILKLFLKKHPDWENPPSTTTRKPRPGEKEGIDYHFVDQQTFESKKKAGEFLETDFHADNWYGTLKKPILELLAAHKNTIVIKDVNGALQIKNQIPETTVFFIDVDEPAELEARIRGRKTETEESIQRRLQLAKKEREFKRVIFRNFTIVNLQITSEPGVRPSYFYINFQRLT